MKKAIVSKIMLLTMAAFAIGLTGCEEKKDDNTPLVTALVVSAQTWEIVEPLNGATGISRNPTFIFKSNCELDTTDVPNDDYAELTYSGGSATAFLSSATCDPFIIEGDTVTMTLDTGIGSLPANMQIGPLVIHGFRCKSPRMTSGGYPFNDYSFMTGD